MIIFFFNIIINFIKLFLNNDNNLRIIMIIMKIIMIIMIIMIIIVIIIIIIIIIANEAADPRGSAVELANHRAVREYRRKISSQRKGLFLTIYGCK